MFSQIKNFYTTLYRSPCHKCRGAGCVICRHCHGTKIRRLYPLKAQDPERLPPDHPDLKYECYHCGPYALNDFDYEKEGTDEEAWNMMDNLKAAMANRERPHKSKAAAGTIACPSCAGQCYIIRHTPDFERLFGFHGTWLKQIARRDRRRRSPLDIFNIRPDYQEILTGKPPKLSPVPKKMPNIRGLEGRSLDEIILPYIDDSDTTDDEEPQNRDYE